MAVNIELGGISTFDCKSDPSSISTRWKRWRKSFEFFVVGKGVKDDEQKTALLLHCAGIEVQDIFDTLKDPGPGNLAQGEQDTAGKFEKAIRTLNSYFTPQINIPYERHIFRQLNQEENETVDQYVARLKRQGHNCDFADIDEQIRDQVIDKCNSTVLRRKLLEKGTALTLTKVQGIARAMEAVDIQVKQMEGATAKQEVNRVFTNPKKTSTPTKKRGVCYRCGKEGHYARDKECSARSMTCTKCGRIGHCASMCQTKFVHKRPVSGHERNKVHSGRYEQNKHSTVNEVTVEDEFVFTINPEGEPLQSNTINVQVGGVVINDMLIDSGATCNIINEAVWKSLKSQGIRCKSELTTKKLYSYATNKPLEILGKFQAETQVANDKVKAEFYVIKGNSSRSLLGSHSAQKLGVLKMGLNANAIKEADIFGRFDCFDGLGKLKGYQAKIHVNPDVPPVAQHPRPIPFSMRPKLAAKLDELIKFDVIEKVEGPTSWVSPVVIIPKSNGDIRLCVDMRRANKAVIRERHPIPTVDEVLHNMNGSTVFSKLDLKWGFHQIELTEESRDITTFVTHKGLFRYKRLMFGISSAPELYQYIIQQVIADCDGAQNISDDVFVHGRTAEEHDDRLQKVLECMQRKGLTLNKGKCIYGMDKITFMGHILSDRGIGPTEGHVKAVLEAREPETAAEVRSFLGLVNFSARYIPNLATTAEPLRRLTRKSTKFEWGHAQKRAFNCLKRALANADTLAYFDKDAETQVICDASPVGIGAVLVQKQNGESRAVSYASKSLTSVERRYSQTEKEALAIVWACERFNLYLYGIKFELLTDHKPLTYIYSERSKPSARIERWVLRLQPYDFTVKYIPGPQNIADSLSRLISNLPVQNTGRNEAEEYIRFVAENAAPKALPINRIEQESANDAELRVLRNCVKSGNWNTCPPGYKAVRTELSIIGQIVLRDTRIVIPVNLRKQVVNLAHEGHQGIVKTKQRLRTKVWWPGIDREAEQKCRTCYGCQLVGQPSNPEPVKSTPLPTGPWRDVAADLLGPLPSGEYLLVIVDYYSRFFEVDILKTVTSEKIIEAMDHRFTTHGYPVSMKADNGPQFISQMFEEYLNENGIQHRRTTPLWPQANGEVERQNSTLIKSMKIAQAQGQDWRKELNKFLMAYRTTPHTTTGVTPAELMFRRKIRTKMPELDENVKREDDRAVRDRDNEMKQKVKDYADHRRNAQHSDIQTGDKVLLQQRMKNKLSTRYEEIPYEVVDRYGSQVTVQSPDAVKYKRNISHLRKFRDETETEGAREKLDELPVMHSEENCMTPETTIQINDPTSRPHRTIHTPKYLEDYVTQY